MQLPKPRKKKGWGKWLAIIAVVLVTGIVVLWAIEREELIKENFDPYIESLVDAIKNDHDEYANYLYRRIGQMCDSLTLDERSVWDHYLDELYNDNIYDAALLDEWLNTTAKGEVADIFVVAEETCVAEDGYFYNDYADTLCW